MAAAGILRRGHRLYDELDDDPGGCSCSVCRAFDPTWCWWWRETSRCRADRSRSRSPNRQRRGDLKVRAWPAVKPIAQSAGYVFGPQGATPVWMRNWLGVAFGDPDAGAAGWSYLQILGGGRTSRLYRQLNGQPGGDVVRLWHGDGGAGRGQRRRATCAGADLVAWPGRLPSFGYRRLDDRPQGSPPAPPSSPRRRQPVPHRTAAEVEYLGGRTAACAPAVLLCSAISSVSATTSAPAIIVGSRRRDQHAAAYPRGLLVEHLRVLSTCWRLFRLGLLTVGRGNSVHHPRR